MLDGDGLELVRYIFAGIERFLNLVIECLPAEHVDWIRMSLKKVADGVRRNRVALLLPLFDAPAPFYHEVGVLNVRDRLLDLPDGTNQRPRELNGWFAPVGST